MPEDPNPIHIARSLRDGLQRNIDKIDSNIATHPVLSNLKAHSQNTITALDIALDDGDEELVWGVLRAVSDLSSSSSLFQEALRLHDQLVAELERRKAERES